ncbi:hypothetical protein V5N11_013054 [Cardamine amara subsp. amara]|uniref:Uncharacterized protein n=1 Tax=Cardamine amara subsp. amara TaxID=228776 RepID=A0ABD1A129_CARAN
MILFLTVEEMMDMNRSRRLNFNAPFLSTKRHVTQEKLPGQFQEASVPFCWETSPGMPKNSSLMKHDSESETPRLKLPPGRLKVHGNGENEDFDDASESLTPARLLRLKKRDNQVYFHQTNQDVVDVLSLTQAIDMVEQPKDSVSESDDGSSGGGGSNGYLTMESTERSEDMSPSYIIERFLPDAAALAAVTSAASQKRKKKLSYLNAATVRQSCFSPKACGLHVLLPWSTMHRICGVKNAFSPSSHNHLQPKFITKEN